MEHSGEHCCCIATPGTALVQQVCCKCVIQALINILPECADDALALMALSN